MYNFLNTSFDYLSKREKDLLHEHSGNERSYPDLYNSKNVFISLCHRQKLFGKRLDVNIIRNGFPSEPLKQIRKFIIFEMLRMNYSLYEISQAFERKESTILRWYMIFDE